MTSDPPPNFPTIELSDPELEYDGLRHATVFSRALGRRADCTLWAPPGTHVELPLLVLLHGVHGSHWGWSANGAAHRTAARLIEAGEIAPVALAMPSDGLFGHGSSYLPHAGGDFATWILDEVPALAAAVLPAVDSTRPLALGGLSMGGFGALVLGAARERRVHTVVALSAITGFRQMGFFVGALDVYDVPDQMRSAAAMWRRCDQPPRLLLACGGSDPIVEHNRSLHAALDDASVEHVWIEDDGDHQWSYWRSHVEMMLRFVDRAR